MFWSIVANCKFAFLPSLLIFLRSVLKVQLMLILNYEVEGQDEGGPNANIKAWPSLLLLIRDRKLKKKMESGIWQLQLPRNGLRRFRRRKLQRWHDIFCRKRVPPIFATFLRTFCFAAVRSTYRKIAPTFQRCHSRTKNTTYKPAFYCECLRKRILKRKAFRKYTAIWDSVLLVFSLSFYYLHLVLDVRQVPNSAFCWKKDDRFQIFAKTYFRFLLTSLSKKMQELSSKLSTEIEKCWVLPNRIKKCNKLYLTNYTNFQKFSDFNIAQTWLNPGSLNIYKNTWCKKISQFCTLVWLSQ